MLPSTQLEPNPLDGAARLSWSEGANPILDCEVLIGSSPALRAALDQVRQAAGTDVNILLEGESGTGKELLARLIHRESSRRRGPFVAVHCTAVPGSRLERELFGDTRGAFSATAENCTGKLALASGGTLFLNGIEGMPFLLQLKLLRVLRQREFYRLGEAFPVKFDARVIVASNRSLRAMVEGKRFLKDLYYRLDVIRLTLPPLRERGNEVIELAEFFATRFAAPGAAPVLSPAFREALLTHRWPGNVRELAAAVRHAVSLSKAGEIDGSLPLSDTGWLHPGLSLRQLEKHLLEITLHATAGNRTRAAELLGISLRTVRNKIREHGLPAWRQT